MANEVVLLGEVAARGSTMIRCWRCDRAGRLSLQRLLAQHGPDVSVRHLMEPEVGACPNRDSAQIQNHSDPYSPALGRLFAHRGRTNSGIGQSAV